MYLKTDNNFPLHCENSFSMAYVVVSDELEATAVIWRPNRTEPGRRKSCLGWIPGRARNDENLLPAENGQTHDITYQRYINLPQRKPTGANSKRIGYPHMPVGHLLVLMRHVKHFCFRKIIADNVQSHRPAFIAKTC